MFDGLIEGDEGYKKVYYCAMQDKDLTDDLYDVFEVYITGYDESIIKERVVHMTPLFKSAFADCKFEATIEPYIKQLNDLMAKPNWE